MKAIYLGTFHRLGGPCRVGIQDKVELAIARFNKALCEEAAFFKNIHIIDLENVVRQVGHSQAFDFRFYLRNKATRKED